MINRTFQHCHKVACQLWYYQDFGTSPSLTRWTSRLNISLKEHLILKLQLGLALCPIPCVIILVACSSNQDCAISEPEVSEGDRLTCDSIGRHVNCRCYHSYNFIGVFHAISHKLHAYLIIILYE